MKKIIQIFCKKYNLSSHRLTALLALYFMLALNLSFWRFVFTHAETGGARGPQIARMYIGYA